MNWRQAFAEAGLDPEFYARRERPLDEVLPWSHIDIGVSPEFLKREYQHSLEQRPPVIAALKPAIPAGWRRLESPS